MLQDNYNLYLEKTVASCPDKVKRHLIKQFLEFGIATKNESDSGQLYLPGLHVVDITDKNLTEQVVSCIQSSEKARLIYEKWEFIKDYKYSVIFTCDNFLEFKEKVLKIQPLDNISESNNIFTSFNNPVAYHIDEYSFLKFNLYFAALHPLTQEEFLLKYPFLVVLHKKHNLIEFRFDVIKRVYLTDKKEQTIYAELISSMRAYLEQNFACNVVPLDLDFMVNVCKNDENVKLIAQFMKLPSGGNAQLEVGNNQEYVLPLIGEMRTLLSDNQTELEKVPTIREALEQFMFEMEEMSDYPWIELLWENEIKTRSNRVKFVFNYMNNSYCLIQHYYNNVLIGMERMNNVIKYISDHRDDDTQQTE